MSDNPYDPYKDATGGYSAPGHDPYGRPSGHYGGGPYGPAPGYGYTPPPPRPEHEGRAITALILSCVQLVLCCGVTAIPGIVFGALALGEKYDPERGERLTKNAWLSVWINFGILGVIIVGYIALVVFAIASSA
ncbi:DUF4190 domain-containing protein [Nocardiopsis changdeensis]|uniref:DUF4190 domain-containing protein n=1 Tax=Nocardiopsis changdeensis TaxID=2831969 RepID=A0ABX8BML0_9ACTN|nr:MULTISPECIES: DUF4190 domain-containing protein [Nocardiopsis]QKW32171.1 DUF4190 domain-containing protein [Nocardiopsis flavescens]QUX23479.1 DUF4190 domain-containing protein [Nocardiopsis changdeensis]QYX39423.1 hypothetical protein K1J57_13070 [Nocardiopsis sp. MT53]